MGMLSPQFSPSTMAMLCTRLSSLYDAGIPLARCLALLEDTRRVGLRRVLRRVRADVERGASLAEAVRARSREFPAFFIAMVAAGEESGTLSAVLAYLARDYEQEVGYRRAFSTAVTYPICVVVAAVLVIPIFRMVMLGATDNQIGWFIVRTVSGPALALGVYAVLTRLRPVRALSRPLLASLKATSSIARGFDLANALRALSALYASGLSLPRSLELTAGVCGNPRLRAVFLDAVPAMRRGASLTEALTLHGALPSEVAQALRYGEQSGALDSALEKAGASLRDYAQHRLRLILVSLESILILALGAAVVTGHL